MDEVATARATPGAPIELRDLHIARTSVEESDAYERSVRGIEIQSVRTGEGHGPTSIMSEVGTEYVVTSVTTGFPMFNSTTVADDLLVAIAIRSAPPAARWSGIDLEPGMVLVYGPGADHTAVNPEGMSFTFAAVAVNDLERVAESMRSELVPPLSGDVANLAPSPASARLHESLTTHIDSVGQRPPTTLGGSRLLASLTAALDHPRTTDRIEKHSEHAYRRIARSCIEYAETIGRVPTIPELRRVAGVSERTLLRAFTATFGTPPSVYFRKWGITAARTRLTKMPMNFDGAVTTTAYDLGFHHLGRFARYYRQQYGESPSETAKRS